MKLRVIIIISIILSSVTAWAGLTKTEVSQLYVAMFGRASEGEGNAYWRTTGLDMETTANVMLETDAAKNYFGASLNSNQAFIEHIYLNTLNKTIADDAAGISYWVGLLNGGLTRGQVSASLVGVIKDYAPGGPYYDPDNAATIAAYWQFTNRVTVSDYMADTVYDTPEDWATSTAFSSGLIVTDDFTSVDAAKGVVNSFINGASCTYRISPSSGSFTSNGGTNVVSVTASSSGCAWTASESLDWVSLSTTSGTGSGAISVTVDANTEAARSGSITIAGQTYTIGQAATASQPTDDFGDSASDAENMPIGEINGEIEINGDEDWFKLNLNIGNRYYFNIKNSDITTLTITLLNSSNEIIDAEIGDGNIMFTPSSSGSFYLKVNDSLSESTGLYSIYSQLYKHAVASLTGADMSNSFLIELEAAQYISSDMNIDNEAQFVADDDGFDKVVKVYLEKDATYNFASASHTISTEQNYNFYLFDSSGKNIATSINTLSSSNYCEIFGFVPETSDFYYIQADWPTDPDSFFSYISVDEDVDTVTDPIKKNFIDYKDYSYGSDLPLDDMYGLLFVNIDFTPYYDYENPYNRK